MPRRYPKGRPTRRVQAGPILARTPAFGKPVPRVWPCRHTHIRVSALGLALLEASMPW